VTLPFILLLMDYWPLQRIFLIKTVSSTQKIIERKEQEKIFLKLILEKLPFLALSIVSSIVTLYAQLKGGAVAKITGVPLGFRLINALVAYVSYMFKMIWPHNLSVIYPLPNTLTMLQGSGAGFFLVIISAMIIRMARRHPPLIVGWLWYIGTLVPVIGLVQVGNQSIADRYTYISLIGLFIIAAWGIPALFPESRHRNAALAITASLLLFASSMFTWIQLAYWENSITLFRHATRVVDDNYVAHILLGNTFTKQGEFNEAISNFSAALHRHPDNEEALTGMGIAVAKQGNLEGASRYFRKALDVKPDSAEDHSNLGFTLTQLGKDSEGIHHLLEALRLEPESPNNAEIHFHIGTSFASLGKIDESLYHFTTAIKIKPDHIEAHYNLGVALARLGKLDPAINSFSEALRLKPDFTEAALNLNKAIRMKEKK
jgi:tetratricopeptide (TPR) repeat protein